MNAGWLNFREMYCLSVYPSLSNSCQLWWFYTFPRKEWIDNFFFLLLSLFNILSILSKTQIHLYLFVGKAPLLTLYLGYQEDHQGWRKSHGSRCHQKSKVNLPFLSCKTYFSFHQAKNRFHTFRNLQAGASVRLSSFSISVWVVRDSYYKC